MAPNGISVTSTNRGPLLNIINWILLVIMCLATLIKVISKWIMVRNLQHDDAYMVAAMLSAVGLGITISAQVSAGLGQHMSTLSTEQILDYQKTTYASQMLYTVSLCLTRMALLQILMTLSRKSTRRLAVHGVMIFNIILVVVIIFTIAFQCPLPRPWEVLSPNCSSQNTFWTVFGVIDVLVDLVTVFLPTYLLYDLHIGWRYKISVIIAFSSRVLIIPLTITRLVFLNHASERVFDDFNIVLLTSIHANLNIVLTCIPFLKPVMDGIQSGILASDIRSLAPITSSGYLFSTNRKRSGKPEGFELENGHTADCSTAGAKQGNSEESMAIKRTREISIRYVSS